MREDGRMDLCERIGRKRAGLHDITWRGIPWQAARRKTEFMNSVYNGSAIYRNSIELPSKRKKTFVSSRAAGRPARKKILPTCHAVFPSSLLLETERQEIAPLGCHPAESLLTLRYNSMVYALLFCRRAHPVERITYKNL